MTPIKMCLSLFFLKKQLKQSNLRPKGSRKRPNEDQSEKEEIIKIGVEINKIES